MAASPPRRVSTAGGGQAVMVGHRWGRTLAPGIVALGGLAMVATSTQAARDRPWAPPDCPGGGAARVAIARAADPPDPASVAGEPWFRADPRLDGAGALDGQRLTVGRRGGGAPATLDLPAESFAAGPFGDLILVGEDDGITSALATLDLAAGCRVDGRLDGGRHPPRDGQPGRLHRLREPGRPGHPGGSRHLVAAPRRGRTRSARAAAARP